jgi:hypothetical protein
MIRVRAAYQIVGSLPIDNFPRAAAVLRRVIRILDNNYAEVWGAKTGVDTKVLDAFATDEIDHGIVDAALEIVTRLPREDYIETRVIMEHVVRYFISDVQKHWSQIGRGPIRELLRVIEGGAA